LSAIDNNIKRFKGFVDLFAMDISSDFTKINETLDKLNISFEQIIEK